MRVATLLFGCQCGMNLLCLKKKKRYIWSFLSHLVVFLPPVTVAENSVFAAGAEPWTVLWRIFAERQSDWKRNRRFDFSGEGFLFLSFCIFSVTL